MTFRFSHRMLLAGVLTLSITACKKEVDEIRKPVPPLEKPGNSPGQPAPALKEIFLHASVVVGGNSYDSLPGTAIITSWDTLGVATSRQVELRAGITPVNLPVPARQYKLSFSKWNTVSERTLDSSQVSNGMLVELKGERTAKRLSLTEEFIEVEGQWLPQAKALYQYTGNGQLDQVVYHQKKPQVYELQHILTDKARFSNGRLQGVDRMDAAGKKVGQTSYEYDANGILTHISNESYGTTIHSVLEYSAAHESRSVDAYYLFDDGKTMNYKMEFRNGNKVRDEAASSTGAGESGTYAFDSAINPFYGVAFPDLYLTHHSKNNMVQQQKGFAGAYPSVIAHKMEYSYDADGYPVQLIKYYKSGQTGQDLYRTKTIFTY